jgi:iron complex transport system substrate-binding protein
LHVFLLSLVACLARADPQRVPQRIVAIGPNSAEIICALGACDRIVGVSKFCVYPPELASRPRVGGLYDPDLERIAALRPDLLVTRGRNDALDALCRQLEVGVYEDTTDSIAGIERTVRELGELLGREAAAAETVEGFRRELAAIRERVSGEPRPRVFLTVSRQPDRLANILTTGKGTFLDEMIEIAGGTNVFGHLDMRYPEVSPEAVLAQRPEVIIELMPDLDLTPELERQMRDHWRELGEVPAVRSGRIFFLSDDHCLIPSPRYHRVISRVSRILHPESVGR